MAAGRLLVGEVHRDNQCVFHERRVFFKLLTTTRRDGNTRAGPVKGKGRSPADPA